MDGLSTALNARATVTKLAKTVTPHAFLRNLPQASDSVNAVNTAARTNVAAAVASSAAADKSGATQQDNAFNQTPSQAAAAAAKAAMQANTPMHDPVAVRENLARVTEYLSNSWEDMRQNVAWLMELFGTPDPAQDVVDRLLNEESPRAIAGLVRQVEGPPGVQVKPPEQLALVLRGVEITIEPGAGTGFAFEDNQATQQNVAPVLEATKSDFDGDNSSVTKNPSEQKVTLTYQDAELSIVSERLVGLIDKNRPVAFDLEGRKISNSSDATPFQPGILLLREGSQRNDKMLRLRVDAILPLPQADAAAMAAIGEDARARALKEEESILNLIA